MQTGHTCSFINLRIRCCDTSIRSSLCRGIKVPVRGPGPRIGGPCFLINIPWQSNHTELFLGEAKRKQTKRIDQSRGDDIRGKRKGRD